MLLRVVQTIVADLEVRVGYIALLQTQIKHYYLVILVFQRITGSLTGGAKHCTALRARMIFTPQLTLVTRFLSLKMRVI